MDLRLQAAGLEPVSAKDRVMASLHLYKQGSQVINVLVYECVYECLPDPHARNPSVWRRNGWTIRHGQRGMKAFSTTAEETREKQY